MAPAVPAYGHFPPSSWSEPTVTSTPGSTLAARTGAIQHNLEERSKMLNTRVSISVLQIKYVWRNWNCIERNTRIHWHLPLRVIQIYTSMKNGNNTTTRVRQQDWYGFNVLKLSSRIIWTILAQNSYWHHLLVSLSGTSRTHWLGWLKMRKFLKSMSSYVDWHSFGSKKPWKMFFEKKKFLGVSHLPPNMPDPVYMRKSVFFFYS